MRQICKMRGSLCEFCNNREIIFPFDLIHTVRCPDCRSLAHRKCFRAGTCPMCARIAKLASARKSQS